MTEVNKNIEAIEKQREEEEKRRKAREEQRRKDNIIMKAIKFFKFSALGGRIKRKKRQSKVKARPGKGVQKKGLQEGRKPTNEGLRLRNVLLRRDRLRAKSLECRFCPMR